MTTEQTMMIIAIEKLKMFILNECPINEISDNNMQQITIGYRIKDITLTKALHYMIPLENKLSEIVKTNWMLNNI
jgi:hypothetical protein